ncbi:MAG: hypothetical protein Q9190_002138 [Brigantiaea leucoxantha]
MAPSSFPTAGGWANREKSAATPQPSFDTASSVISPVGQSARGNRGCRLGVGSGSSSSSSSSNNSRGGNSRSRQRATTDLTRLASDRRSASDRASRAAPQSTYAHTHTHNSPPAATTNTSPDALSIFGANTETQPSQNPKSVQPSHHRHNHPPPSLPIDIPQPRSRRSRPTTPLTARVEPVHFPFPRFPQVGPSLHGHYTHSDQQGHSRRHVNRTSSPPDSQASQTSSMRSDRSYTPSSPLSPTMSVHSPPAARQPRRPENLHIPNLPPFHPANFESRGKSPRTSHTASASAAHARQLSDAQHKLQQYQRDIVMSATRAAGRSPLSPAPINKPSPPRLHPLGSPGPVTPLMLEGGEDYLIAGLGGTPSPRGKDKNRQELLEKLLGEEHDRRRYPERVEGRSPAVSPAGGRG